MYQEDLEQLLQQYGSQLSSLYQKVDGFESKLVTIDSRVYGFKDQVQDENDKSYEQLNQLGQILNQKLDLHKQQLEQEMIQLQNQSQIQYKEQLDEQIQEFIQRENQKEKKNPNHHHSIVEKICLKVYEKSKTQYEKIDNNFEKIYGQIEDLKQKVVDLEQKTDEQANIIQNQQQYIIQNIENFNVQQNTNVIQNQQEKQTLVIPKQRSKSSQKYKVIQNDFEKQKQIEQQLELNYKIEGLKKFINTQQNQWENSCKVSIKNQEEKEQQLNMQKEENQQIIEQINALKQLVEQSQEKKGDNQIEDIERIGVKQVEQLRYEMQQKVESQLFNNHNNMNSHIDSLKQRMEKYEGQNKNINQFCEFTQNQMMGIEQQSKQFSVTCNEHLQSLWETINIFNTRIADNH